jgi:Peptidase family M28
MRMRRAVLTILLFPVVLLSGVQVRLRAVKPELVQQRLQGYKGNDTQRETTLKGFFKSVGCTGEQFSELPVKGLKQPNLLCVLQGGTDSVILVGAHYDHVDAGDGVVDNWSGASMLPSLYEALNAGQRRYTLVFAAFAGEEKGLVGSRYYVKNLAPEKLKKIRAMVCIDTLGLGPTEVWVSKSDKELVAAMATLAHALNLPVTEEDVDGVGMSDEEPFVAKKVPVIMIHSVTQSTLGVLHTPRDNYKALKFDDYYASYRLLSAYLNYLDQTLDPNGSPPK